MCLCGCHLQNLRKQPCHDCGSGLQPSQAQGLNTTRQAACYPFTSVPPSQLYISMLLGHQQWGPAYSGAAHTACGGIAQGPQQRAQCIQLLQFQHVLASHQSLSRGGGGSRHTSGPTQHPSGLGPQTEQPGAHAGHLLSSNSHWPFQLYGSSYPLPSNLHLKAHTVRRRCQKWHSCALALLWGL